MELLGCSSHDFGRCFKTKVPSKVEIASGTWDVGLDDTNTGMWMAGKRVQLGFVINDSQTSHPIQDKKCIQTAATINRPSYLFTLIAKPRLKNKRWFGIRGQKKYEDNGTESRAWIPSDTKLNYNESKNNLCIYTYKYVKIETLIYPPKTNRNCQISKHPHQPYPTILPVRPYSPRLAWCARRIASETWLATRHAPWVAIDLALRRAVAWHLTLGFGAWAVHRGRALSPRLQFAYPLYIATPRSADVSWGLFWVSMLCLSNFYHKRFWTPFSGP